MTQVTEKLEKVTVLFAGDSGDGIQLTGTQFTNNTALHGNDLSTFPDFPAEIRAPLGTLAGVSGFQINFGSTDVFTPGDLCDVLVVMNSAALKKNLSRLKDRGTIIVNTSGFDKRNLRLAGIEEGDNPLNNNSLEGYKVHEIDVTKLTRESLKDSSLSNHQLRTCLNGVLKQDKDNITDTKSNLTNCTVKSPSESELNDLIFASKICKHTKSNTIVLAKNLQLISSGTGQTSRVDALKQAIEKSKNFKFDLNGSVMASDAFFPFPDCVEIAHKSGVCSVIQPGGSIKDNLSIDYCNENNISMVLTGIRHFKH